MTDSSYTEIIIVADRSGSMSLPADPPHTKAERSTNGVADIVRVQKAEPGRVRFSLYQFDTIHDTVAEGAEDLSWTCEPRGGTALLDAVGTAIVKTGERLAAMPEDERPGHVIFVIATDGEENSSVEYPGQAGKDRIAAMVTEQTDRYQWQFVFIGADIDAFDAGHSMGISKFSTLDSSGVAMAAAYSSTNSAITRNRVEGGKFSYNDDERDAAKK
jgi:hypothetical protein